MLKNNHNACHWLIDLLRVYGKLSSFSSVQEPSPPMDAYYLPGAAANGIPETSHQGQNPASRKRKASGDTSAVKKSRVR